MSVLDMATGGLFSIAASDYNRSKQRGENKYEREEQLQAAKELNKEQKNSELKLWKDTGPVGMKQQLEAAGLNAATMYGKGGIGGTTTGGGMPMPSRGQVPDANAATANQLAALTSMSQIKLMDAQAEKAQAEADKTKGVDTDKTTKEIESLTQGITNAKTINELNTVEKDIKNIEYAIADTTVQEAINYIKHAAVKIGGEAKSALVQGNVDEATKAQKIDILNKQIANIAADTILKKVQTETGRAIQTQEAFEAELTKLGLGKNTPWYGKLIGAFANKLGINPADELKKLK